MSVTQITRLLPSAPGVFQRTAAFNRENDASRSDHFRLGERMIGSFMWIPPNAATDPAQPGVGEGLHRRRPGNWVDNADPQRRGCVHP